MSALPFSMSAIPFPFRYPRIERSFAPRLATGMASLLMMATAWAASAATGAALAPETAVASAADAPPRVITLAPNATEMVYAAGGGSLMIATVSASDYPPDAAALPRVGDGITLNLERLIMLRPTLVVGWLRSGPALDVEALGDTLGTEVLYTRPETLADIPADIRRLGHVLGTEDIASRNAAAFEARLATLEARLPPLAARAADPAIRADTSGDHAPRPVRVFVEVGHTPLYTIGNDPLLNDAMRLCGAQNIYADTLIPAPRVPIESVLVQQPELLIIPGVSPEDLEAVRRRWAELGLEAARRGHVHAIDPDALFRPGPRFIDATEALCAAADSVR